MPHDVDETVLGGVALVLAAQRWQRVGPRSRPRTRRHDLRDRRISGLLLHYLTTVYAYNPSTGSWTARVPMPTPRETPAVALAADGKIYIVGGNGSGPIDHVVEAFDRATNTWQSKATGTGQHPRRPVGLDAQREAIRVRIRTDHRPIHQGTDKAWGNTAAPSTCASPTASTAAPAPHVDKRSGDDNAAGDLALFVEHVMSTRSRLASGSRDGAISPSPTGPSVAALYLPRMPSAQVRRHVCIRGGCRRGGRVGGCSGRSAGLGQ